MALNEAEELEVLELKRKRSGRKTEKPITGSSGDIPKPSYLESEIQSFGGLLKGGGRAIEQGGRAIDATIESAKSLLPGGDKPKSPLKSFEEITAERKGGSLDRLLTPETELEESAVGVGKLATQVAAGGGISGGTLKGATGLGSTITRGAAANIPFIPEAVERGGGKGAVVDIALNTALDTFLFGSSKLLSRGKDLSRITKKGINKGLKPTTINKGSLKRMDKFYADAKDAVVTMADNKNNIKILNEGGEIVSHPQTAAQMAQAVDQTKSIIYKKYHDMAVAAGDAGAGFNTTSIVDKLAELSDSKNLKLTPKMRKYAESLFDEISELDGAAPDIIEERIKDLNSSLAGLYEGRVAKAQAQIDASVANLMRKQLDSQITGAVGEGYQALKNQYGSLKAIEKEVNKRALVNARKAEVGLLDFTDIFTGSDLIAGVLTMNPAMLARGATGKGIKEVLKVLNNPDRAIDGMFKAAYAASGKPVTKLPLGSPGTFAATSAIAEQGVRPVKAPDEEKDKLKSMFGRGAFQSDF